MLEAGFVERDTKKGVPVKWGTRDPLAQYDDAAGFVFSLGGVSGSLVNVGGSQYRNEIDGAFLKFNFDGNYCWAVTDKSGNKFYFGSTPESRLEHPQTGWSTNQSKSTFRWALSRVVDVNGNETTLNYTNIGNFLYLSKITYNGHTNGISGTHTVDFGLEDRNDQPVSFRSNFRSYLYKRLSKIIVKVAGQRVRKYDLVYADSPSTFRTLLQSVVLYGPDDTSSLPPVTFTYQVKPFEFEPAVTWTVNDQGTASDYWGAIQSRFDDGSTTHDWVTLMDIDGDALPDRVIRMGGFPHDRFIAQRNTRTGFDSQLIEWGKFNASSVDWGSTERTGRFDDEHDATRLRVVDINGDGYPDRILGGAYNGDSFIVRTNTGLAGYTASFPPAVEWGPTEHEDATISDWFQIAFMKTPDPDGYVNVELLDLTGDALPDRVMRKSSADFTYYVMQRNTGSGFSTWRRYGTLLSQWGDTSPGANSIAYTYSETDINSGYTDIHRWMMLTDINGDGLVDRVMKKTAAPFNIFKVQFNDGAGFDGTLDNWGSVDSQGASSDTSWFSPHSTHTEHQGNDSAVQTMLIDLNGDGLPDRVMRRRDSPYNFFVVQFNTGTGFTSTNHFTGLNSSGEWFWRSPQFTDIQGETHHTVKADLVDINGDALVDRVYCTSPTTWKVQLNKGPFPDLLKKIDNGVGGKVDVTYVPSTTFNNRHKPLSTGDPWAEEARSLLPFVIYVVDSVTTRDGFGNNATTTYDYQGGMYDSKRREFRGFARVFTTDALGTQQRIWFHQGGGMDRPQLGEYQDSTAVAKKGIPFRIQTVGTNGMTNTITLNKVEEVMLNTNGWCFPYISQTIQMEYEGMSTYRATAQQFLYDTNTGNVLKVSNLGEVKSINVTDHTFTDEGSDSIYTHTTYAPLGDILNKPELVTITSDSAGTTKLRETKFKYDSRGNLTNQQAWLTGDTYLTTTSIQYDQYGNPWKITDAAGITTENTYDTTYFMFVEKKVTAGFTNQFQYNPHSGAVSLATDAKGQVSSNQYDVFFRLTNSLVSDLSGGNFIWKERYLYNLGGLAANASYNYVRKQVNNPSDTLDGCHESYVYADGVGRTIQTRVEAETGQYRVSDAFYDLRGNPLFATLPRFGSGSGFTIITGTNLGTYTEYDNFGRAFKVTPGVEAVFDANGDFTDIYGTGGDSGSPVGAAVAAFTDGSDPWASVVTDPEGGVKKSYHDAFGRTTNIVEVTSAGNYVTTYIYDKVGNLTNVTDHVGNKTTIVYDNLGRKTSMTDPDMGTWTYVYDSASRLVQQIDAKNQKIEFVYTNDPLGRLTARKIYNSNSVLVATSTYVYDSNQGESAYVVPKGALFKVTDREGWAKFGYDIRGRTTNTTRHIATNNTSYIVTTQYDDADRPQVIKYPGSTDVRLKYSYDRAGNLTNIASLAGTGTPETFYSTPVFNALGQLTYAKYGAQQQVSFAYYAKSKRLTNKVVTVGTNIQNLAYQYDKVSNLKKITDLVRTNGPHSASITSLSYDSLYRLTNLWSVGLNTNRSYVYNEVGNLMSNDDLGGGLYTYAASGAGSGKSHRVINAGGKSYTYDACGNMVGRGYNVLRYDEENRLVQFDDDGTRLWRNVNGFELTVWIGGIFEDRAGKQLCHVHANGQLIATFEPTGGAWALLHRPLSPSHDLTLAGIFAWPLQNGRTPITVVITTLLAILSVSILSRLRDRTAPSTLEVGRSMFDVRCSSRRRSLFPLRHPVSRSSAFDVGCSTLDVQCSNATVPRSAFRVPRFFHQALSVWLIVALVLATTETNVHAQVYDPVFYYYHGDHLGSSNILVDRTGNIVQQYEYTAFGFERLRSSTSAFPVTHRYTSQHLDEATGLYYYQSRYYDPEIARFIQPDTIVPAVDDPQTLNRYTYVKNNPFKYVDPSGHEFITALIVGVIVGAAIGGATAAATGGNIGMGILTGAIGGLFGGLGAWAGGVIGGTAGGLVGAAAGGAAGGAVSAAISGGDVGMGALTGAISGMIGFGVGKLTGSFLNKVQWSTGAEELIELSATTAGGALGGGIGAELQGGDFGQGAAYGAAGAAIGYGVSYFLKHNNGPLKQGDRNLAHHAMQYLGKIWAIPNTIVGLLWGGVGLLMGAKVSFDHNAIQFEFHKGNAFGDALTLGNTTHYQADNGNWPHEILHTYQSQQIGPLYLPSNVLGKLVALTVSAFTKLDFVQAQERFDWNERGPYASKTWR